MRNNAFWNCKNPNQGPMKRVLCVCSAGLLRSPSLAYYLSNKGFNTRAAGVYDYALIRVDEVLIEWADYIVCAEDEHLNYLKNNFDISNRPVYSLNIPDRYECRSEEVLGIIDELSKELDFVNS